MSVEVRERDELIVSAYFHQIKIDTPVEIIQLCFKWYHIPLFWEYFSSEGQIINNEKTIIKFDDSNVKGPPFVSCYGSIIMASMNNDSIYEYGVKLEGKLAVVIGICDAEFINTDTFFYDGNSHHSSFYALYGWDGDIVSQAPHDRWKRKSYAVGYNNGVNEIKVIYDACNGTLSYKINDKDYGIACNTFKSDKMSY